MIYVRFPKLAMLILTSEFLQILFYLEHLFSIYSWLVLTYPEQFSFSGTPRQNEAFPSVSQSILCFSCGRNMMLYRNLLTHFFLQLECEAMIAGALPYSL